MLLPLLVGYIATEFECNILSQRHLFHFVNVCNCTKQHTTHPRLSLNNVLDDGMQELWFAAEISSQIVFE